MKSHKKKLALPRRTWSIKPVTRIKDSLKRYQRTRVRREERHSMHEETGSET